MGRWRSRLNTCLITSRGIRYSPPATSMMTRSGTTSFATRSTSSPSPACPTTSNSPVRSSSCWRPSRITGWSSTSKTLIGVELISDPSSHMPIGKLAGHRGAPPGLARLNDVLVRGYGTQAARIAALASVNSSEPPGRMIEFCTRHIAMGLYRRIGTGYLFNAYALIAAGLSPACSGSDVYAQRDDHRLTVGE